MPDVRLGWLTRGIVFLIGCEPSSNALAQSGEARPYRGELSARVGIPTIRKPYAPRADDPATTNDESNDHAVGHCGTVTLIASHQESDHTFRWKAGRPQG